MEFVTREISYYGIFEVLYLRRKFDATQQLSEALVRAYSTILQYLSKARHYYEKNTLGAYVSACKLIYFANNGFGRTGTVRRILIRQQA
jgi:hypothetical protein